MPQARDMTEKAKEVGNQVAGRARDLGTQAVQQADQYVNQPMRYAEQTPSKVYMGAVVGSILASAALMLAGRTAAAIFVGLWAPTILNMGLFNKLLQPSQESMTGQWGAQGEYGGGTTGTTGTGSYAAGSTGYGTTGGTETGRAF
jgi:hypothetical protein